MTLSTDSQAMLLLCSHLSLSADAEPAPLTLRDWNPLARKIAASSVKRPGALLGMETTAMQRELELSNEEALRVARLLERSGALAIELERLASLGIHSLTRADAGYPAKFKLRLKDAAPAVLFFSGGVELLGQPGLAVVGSRRLDEAGQDCAKFAGNACGVSGLVLYSGGAKGVDTLSMVASLEARGSAVGLLADSLERAIRAVEWRAALGRGDLCLVTPYSPNAGFSVGTAMGRNKLIYALADYALVVASDAEKGGTWAGASDALKAGWVPVFVLEHPQMPEGNRLLLQRGALPFPYPFPLHFSRLPAWLEEEGTKSAPVRPMQLGLF